jgi:hypothetical protein
MFDLSWVNTVAQQGQIRSVENKDPLNACRTNDWASVGSPATRPATISLNSFSRGLAEAIPWTDTI